MNTNKNQATKLYTPMLNKLYKQFSEYNEKTKVEIELALPELLHVIKTLLEPSEKNLSKSRKIMKNKMKNLKTCEVLLRLYSPYDLSKKLQKECPIPLSKNAIIACYVDEDILKKHFKKK